jgi:hypothetical protein
MEDAALLLQVELALPEMTGLDRSVYAMARLRVQRGEPLKDTQRAQLTRLLTLVQTARRTFTPEGGDHAAD